MLIEMTYPQNVLADEDSIDERGLGWLTSWCVHLARPCSAASCARFLAYKFPLVSQSSVVAGGKNLVSALLGVSSTV
jgi:hypothetical protein